MIQLFLKSCSNIKKLLNKVYIVLLVGLFERVLLSVTRKYSLSASSMLKISFGVYPSLKLANISKILKKVVIKQCY